MSKKDSKAKKKNNDSDNQDGIFKGDRETSDDLNSKEMTALDFASLTGFSEVDRKAVKILHKEKIHTYDFWKKKFDKDFVFNK